MIKQKPFSSYVKSEFKSLYGAIILIAMFILCIFAILNWSAFNLFILFMVYSLIFSVMALSTKDVYGNRNCADFGIGVFIGCLLTVVVIYYMQSSLVQRTDGPFPDVLLLSIVFIVIDFIIVVLVSAWHKYIDNKVVIKDD